MIQTPDDLRKAVTRHFGSIIDDYGFEIEIIDRWSVIFFRPTFALVVSGDREGFNDAHVEKRKGGLCMTGLTREFDRRVGHKLFGMDFGPDDPSHLHDGYLQSIAYVWSNFYKDILSGDRTWLARYGKNIGEPYRYLIPSLARLEIIDS